MLEERVRFSHLKAFARSAAHYVASFRNDRDTPQMRLGRLGHALVLGEREKIVVYDGERRGNAWKDFAKANDGAEIVTVAEHAKARAIADAVARNGNATKLLHGTKKEHRIEWSLCGRECAGTPDAFADDYVLDLKTCPDVSPEKFRFTAQRMGYFAQLSWYLDGLVASGQAAPKRAYIIAVEATDPCVVQCFEMTPGAIEFGRRQYRSWFERLLACESVNHFPGYSEAILPMDALEDVQLDYSESEAAE